MIKILYVESMISYVAEFLKVFMPYIESGEIALTSVKATHRDNLPIIGEVHGLTLESKENLFAVWRPGQSISFESASFVKIDELRPLVEDAEIIFIEEDLFGRPWSNPDESGAGLVRRWKDAGIDFSKKILIGSSDLPQPYVEHHSYTFNSAIETLKRLGILAA